MFTPYQHEPSSIPMEDHGFGADLEGVSKITRSPSTHAECAWQIIQYSASTPLSGGYLDWYTAPLTNTITPEPMFHAAQSELRREMEALLGIADHTAVAAVFPSVCPTIPLLCDGRQMNLIRRYTSLP